MSHAAPPPPPPPPVTSDRRHRAWMRLPSGRRLDLMHPAPEAWLDSDLAIRLSRTSRWGGESSWPRPLSVAQHSLTVLALRRRWSAGFLSADDELLELLHDAEEGFLGFDCISPLKAALGEPFREVEARLVRAIAVRYRLADWSTETHALHKRADTQAAASEAVHCVGWTSGEVRDVLGIGAEVLTDDPLVAVYGCTPWEPWAADVAADRFSEALAQLLKKRNARSMAPSPPGAGWGGGVRTATAPCAAPSPALPREGRE